MDCPHSCLAADASATRRATGFGPPSGRRLVSCRHFTRQRWSHLISVRLHERRALISLIVLRSGGVCCGLRMHEACACSHALKHAINAGVGAARPSAIAPSKIAQAQRSIPAVPIHLVMVPLPLLCAAARATRVSYNKSASLANSSRSRASTPALTSVLIVEKLKPRAVNMAPVANGGVRGYARTSDAAFVASLRGVGLIVCHVGFPIGACVFQRREARDGFSPSCLADVK